MTVPEFHREAACDTDLNNLLVQENEPTRCLSHHAGSDHNHPLTEKGHVMAVTNSTGAAAAPKRAANAGRRTLNITAEVAAMERMTVPELKRKYEEVFREACRSNHKQWLIKRIAWRMQANAEGGLSERARRRAMELANDADLRMKAPQQRTSHESKPGGRDKRQTVSTNHDARVPMPGSVITRKYKGRTLMVTVREDRFEYEGESYPSLSAVAKAITGSHCNGFLFFRLNGKRGRK